MARTDYKLTLVKIDFSMNAYKNIQKKTLNDWVQQQKNFFHFIESFGERQNPNGKVLIWMLEDPKNWNFLLVKHFSYSFLKTYLNHAKTIRYKITGNFQKK